MSDLPILTFVTSLRHPDCSNDYERVETLLARTLRGLASQTDGRCRVVVVANRRPALPSGSGLDVTVIEVGFAAPALQADGRLSIDQVRRDKGSKLAIGIGQVDAGHVMLLDADDYVSRDLTAFVAQHPSADGWYVEDGLMYDSRTGLSLRVPRFNTVCGSSLIVRRDLLPRVSASAPVQQDDLLADVGEDVVLRWLGSHRFLADDLGLAPLPFVGAVYDVDNGENHSLKAMPALGRPLWPSRAARFGIAHQQPLRMALSAGSVVGRRGAASLRRRMARFTH